MFTRITSLQRFIMSISQQCLKFIDWYYPSAILGVNFFILSQCNSRCEFFTSVEWIVRSRLLYEIYNRYAKCELLAPLVDDKMLCQLFLFMVLSCQLLSSHFCVYALQCLVRYVHTYHFRTAFYCSAVRAVCELISKCSLEFIHPGNELLWTTLLVCWNC